MTFKSDKPLTHCQSQFRTYEMYGIQDKLYNHPTYLQWNYDDVKVHKETLERIGESTGHKFKGQIVKCLVTIVEREE